MGQLIQLRSTKEKDLILDPKNGTIHARGAHLEEGGDRIEKLKRSIKKIEVLLTRIRDMKEGDSGNNR